MILPGVVVLSHEIVTGEGAGPMAGCAPPVVNAMNHVCWIARSTVGLDALGGEASAGLQLRAMNGLIITARPRGS
jgi:hypothetical protein